MFRFDIHESDNHNHHYHHNNNMIRQLYALHSLNITENCGEDGS